MSAVSIIVVKDPELRKRIIPKTDLTWTALETYPNTLIRACELDHNLCTTTASADTTVKQECWEVTVVHGLHN